MISGYFIQNDMQTSIPPPLSLQKWLNWFFSPKIWVMFRSVMRMHKQFSNLFSFIKIKKIHQNNVFSSKVVKFTWNMRNVLNRKKNQILDFSVFIFQVMVIFVTHYPNFLWIFHDNSKIKIGEFLNYLFHSIQHTPHPP